MELSKLPSLFSLFIFITLTLARPQAGQGSTVQALSTTTTTGPTILTGDKMGAASLTDGISSTFVVYQAENTSIHGLSGTGSPITSNSYASSIILDAGKARNDTPIAVATAYGLFSAIHVYYLSSDSCSNGEGNYIYELVDFPFHGWGVGSLNAVKICSSNKSNFLYALGPRTCSTTSAPTTAGGPIRIGYMAADTGYLSEAYIDDSGKWTSVTY